MGGTHFNSARSVRCEWRLVWSSWRCSCAPKAMEPVVFWWRLWRLRRAYGAFSNSIVGWNRSGRRATPTRFSMMLWNWRVAKAWEVILLSGCPRLFCEHFIIARAIDLGADILHLSTQSVSIKLTVIQSQSVFPIHPDTCCTPLVFYLLRYSSLPCCFPCSRPSSDFLVGKLNCQVSVLAGSQSLRVNINGVV